MNIPRGGLHSGVLFRFYRICSFGYTRYARERGSENLCLPIIYYGRAYANVAFDIYVLWLGYRS